MKTSKRRFDDYEVYQKLCDHLSIHESKRKAVFGVDDFYIHAKELISNSEHARKIEKIRFTSMYTRFFIKHSSRGKIMIVYRCKIRFNPLVKKFQVSYLYGYQRGEFTTKGEAIEDARRA
jgi:hypothetical protein